MANSRKLPIGVQSFEVLRNGGFLYVDKTRYVWDLADNGKVYFLSRPRRFGKSLLVSTLEAYFRGRRDLFEGLAIQALEDARGEGAWAEHPVITFSLSGGGCRAGNGLSGHLREGLAECAETYGLPLDGLDDSSLPLQFGRLIRALHGKTGRRVVVLVDEGDEPVLSTMGEDDARLYSGFFCALKDEDAHLKFEFFAAAGRFARLSVFSDLNHLHDISFLPKCSGICGVTEGELLESLEPETERLARAQGMTEEECLAKLAETYGGYRFAAGTEGAYNPFSLLNAFARGDFGYYWFESDGQGPLIEKLQTSGYSVERFADGVEATESQLKGCRPENPSPLPLFYQSGYLTIAGYDEEFELYSLRFPNEEVRCGFLKALAERLNC